MMDGVVTFNVDFFHPEIGGGPVLFEPREVELRTGVTLFPSLFPEARFESVRYGASEETGSLPYIIDKKTHGLVAGRGTSRYVRSAIRNLKVGWHNEKWATEGLAHVLLLIVDYFRWWDDLVVEEWTWPIIKSSLPFGTCHRYYRCCKKEFEQAWIAFFKAPPSEKLAVEQLGEVLKALKPLVIANKYIGGPKVSVEDVVYFSYLSVLFSMPLADHDAIDTLLHSGARDYLEYCQRLFGLARHNDRLRLAAGKHLWTYNCDSLRYSTTPGLYPNHPQSARNKRKRLFELQKLEDCDSPPPDEQSFTFVDRALKSVRALLTDPIRLNNHSGAVLSSKEYFELKKTDDMQSGAMSSYVLFAGVLVVAGCMAVFQSRRTLTA